MQPHDAEMTTLRERLEDAESVCRALQSGEVDAFVVGRSDDDRRVLVLSEAYTGYRRLVEDMPQCALTVLSSGEILYANRAFCRAIERSVEEVRLSTLDAHVASEYRMRLRRLLGSSPGGDEAEIALLRGDGTQLRARMVVAGSSDDFLTVLAMPVPDADLDDDDAKATIRAIRDGAVDGFVVGGQRVALLDSANAPYQALVERMRQGAVTAQADGTILFVNERFASLVGLGRPQMLGLSLADLLDERDRAGFLELIAAPEGGQLEVRLRCSNGTRPTVLAAMSVLDDHRLFLFSDQSERKRHAASDERTRRFLGHLAHEFAEILRSVEVSLGPLRRAKLSTEGASALRAVERATTRLLSLVEDLRSVNPKE